MNRVPTYRIIPAFLLIIFQFTGLTAQKKKPVYFKITNQKYDSTIQQGIMNIRFHFQDTSGSTIPQDIIVIANKDTIRPKFNKDRTATIKLPIGNYAFWFRSKWYHPLKTDTLKLVQHNSYSIRVLLVAREMNMPEIIYSFDKPVIYLYPKQRERIQVRLDTKSTLDFTYPAYHEGWDIIANPDGVIECNGSNYRYLFWEGRLNAPFDNNLTTTGFIVDSDTLVSFLEHSLRISGLNSYEKQDFITYWGPRMKIHKKTFIHFDLNEEINAVVGLTINPAPDCLIRVYMYWMPLESTDLISIKKQELKKTERHGFTVVEWGGIELNKVILD